MLKSKSGRMLLTLGLGALLGYAVAASDFKFAGQATAQAPAAEKSTPVPSAAVENATNNPAASNAVILLAQATQKGKGATSSNGARSVVQPTWCAQYTAAI